MNREHTAILLAAGLSSRMGQIKALLPWQGKPLIQYQLDQLVKAGLNEIIVVLGYHADQLKRYLSDYDVNIAVNEKHGEGKASSIRKGAAFIDGTPAGIFVSSVDQPVPYKTLALMIKHIEDTGARAVIPVYQNKRGHPILLNGILKSELLRVKEETLGIRGVIRKIQRDIAYLKVDDPAVLYNFNRPEDYLNKGQEEKDEGIRNRDGHAGNSR